MWEFIDKIVYINLDSRKDRLITIKKFIELGKFPSCKVVRFPAILQKPGTVGCTKSHIAILRMAIKNRWNNVLILEDDVEWVKSVDSCYGKIKDLILQQNDVVLLGGGYDTIVDDNRVLFSYCTSSYIVKSHYYETLLKVYENGLKGLTGNDDMSVTPGTEERIKNDNVYEIDTYWSRLQRTHNWRAMVPAVVQQYTSYSDVRDNIRTWQ